MTGRYLEDFQVGETIEAPDEYLMTPERIHSFAADYDPQPIHLDPQAAAHEMFGGIVASGWHSLSATMRLMVGSRLFEAGPIVGVGVDRLRYLQPVRAGDVLRARGEVIELRPSATHPERGYVVLRVTTTRQDGVAVLTQDWTLLVPRRM
jgi:acyl dehydratase